MLTIQEIEEKKTHTEKSVIKSVIIHYKTLTAQSVIQTM